jgi:hypothetical protein
MQKRTQALSVTDVVDWVLSLGVMHQMNQIPVMNVKDMAIG